MLNKNDNNDDIERCVINDEMMRMKWKMKELFKNNDKFYDREVCKK